MRRLLPDSIAARTVLVLLIGLTLSHVLSTAVYAPAHSAGSDSSAGMARQADAVNHLARIVRLLDRLDGDDRQSLAAILTGPGQEIRLGATPELDVPPIRLGADDPDGDAALRAALPPFLSGLDGQRLRLAVDPDPNRGGALLHDGADHPRLRLSLRLDDGSWVNAGLILSRPAPPWSARFWLSALIMAAGVVLFSILATRWIGRPLASFTQAADRLGRHVQAAPLPLDGPREVRGAAQAFNRMQDRIRRFVEDRTRMLAALSHDLRSPITRLRLRTELLPDTSDRARMLADLRDMEDMVAQALAFARNEAEDEDEAVQAVDLSAMLEALCDNTTDMGQPALFHWPGRRICHCRPLAVKRALANLIENAARHGGQARVRMDQQGSDMRVIIEDDGPGIPAAELEAVFTPFFRLDRSRGRKTGGMGLGLTVARAAIRAHGGDIVLENRAEGGLRAVVTLPQAREDHGHV